MNDQNLICLKNKIPTLNEFKQLMANTDNLLNREARKRPQDFSCLAGKELEPVVRDALINQARGTRFDGKNNIILVSGASFPDIVANGYYGVEVKSTSKDHWTSTGSSILESTRIEGVERIYLTFGKLGGDTIEFLSKPCKQPLPKGRSFIVNP